MKKTAVVTGSSRGIGFAIAKQLGMDGYNIVMVATGLQEKIRRLWMSCKPSALPVPMCRQYRESGRSSEDSGWCSGCIWPRGCTGQQCGRSSEGPGRSA